MLEDLLEDFKNFFLPMIMIVVVFVTIIIIPFFILEYFSSCRQAKIYNKLNQTNFTCSDFFWAGEQINQQTQTIELK